VEIVGCVDNRVETKQNKNNTKGHEKNLN